MKNPGIEFEEFTARICEKLLLLCPGGFYSQVKHNVKLIGKSGVKHQIDVYWEYEINGELHRVLIECKNYKSRVSVSKVRELVGLLDDFDNAYGIIVSSKGFQQGAREFAKHHSILLKMLRSPNSNEVFGELDMSNYSDIRHCFYKINEEWDAQNSLYIPWLKKKYAQLYPEKEEYWHGTSYFPLQTKDDVIRNSSGEEIASIAELTKKLPNKDRNETSIVFSFEDGWVTYHDGDKIKIDEVKFEYEHLHHNKKFNLLAVDFVDGILTDVFSGEDLYVSRF